MKNSKKNNSTFIIAEIAQAHDGSLGIAHSFIDAAKECGADAVKFQTHISEIESSSDEPFRIPFSYKDKTRQDYWKRTAFSNQEWHQLKNHCDDINIEFLSSPFSIAAIKLLESIGMKQYKIASGEISNNLLIDTIAKLKKPMILSSGLSTINDIQKCINRIEKYHKKYSVLQCTSEYPTLEKHIGLNVLHEFKETFNCPVGLSDHSGTPEPALAAVSLGATIIECHLTFDKAMFGPDAIASLNCKSFKKMVSSIRKIETYLNNPIDKTKSTNTKLQTIFGKSITNNQALKKGTQIKASHLDTKKPANKGISCENYEKILGKTLNKDLKEFSFIQESDLD
tara:strand:+ start:818 stop:1837 length:1020 start_codon:yes stop_codon:yes gene_type:complete